MKLKELIKSNYVIVPSVLNIRSEKYDMEWSVADEAIFRRKGTARWNWSEMNDLNKVQSPCR